MCLLPVHALFDKQRLNSKMKNTILLITYKLGLLITNVLTDNLVKEIQVKPLLVNESLRFCCAPEEGPHHHRPQRGAELGNLKSKHEALQNLQKKMYEERNTEAACHDAELGKVNVNLVTAETHARTSLGQITGAHRGRGMAMQGQSRGSCHCEGFHSTEPCHQALR